MVNRMKMRGHWFPFAVSLGLSADPLDPGRGANQLEHRGLPTAFNATALQPVALSTLQPSEIRYARPLTGDAAPS